jgi:hypothetical protein
MIVRIDTHQSPAAITLDDPTAFNTFHVCVQGADAPALAAAIARVGSLADPDHAFIDRAALEGLAGDHAQEPDWQRSLESMLSYAASKGWTNDNGAIRAHIERADA